MPNAAGVMTVSMMSALGCVFWLHPWPEFIVCTSADKGGTTALGWLVDAASEPQAVRKAAVPHSRRPATLECCMGDLAGRGENPTAQKTLHPPHKMYSLL